MKEIEMNEDELTLLSILAILQLVSKESKVAETITEVNSVFEEVIKTIEGSKK